MKRIRRAPRSNKKVDVVEVSKDEKKVEVTKMPARTLEDTVSELGAVKKHIKELQAREKELRNDLETILMVEGTADSRGSIKIVVGDRVAQRIAKKSVRLNQDKAKAYLEKKGLWSKMSKQIESLDEDKLEKAVEEKTISVEDLESITDIRVTYAVGLVDYKPEEPEDMPQIEVTRATKG